jgi:hypothetical protein
MDITNYSNDAIVQGALLHQALENVGISIEFNTAIQAVIEYGDLNNARYEEQIKDEADTDNNGIAEAIGVWVERPSKQPGLTEYQRMLINSIYGKYAETDNLDRRIPLTISDGVPVYPRGSAKPGELFACNCSKESHVMSKTYYDKINRFK